MTALISAAMMTVFAALCFLLAAVARGDRLAGAAK